MKRKTNKETILKRISGLYAVMTAIMTRKGRGLLMPIKKYAFICMGFLLSSVPAVAVPVTYDFNGFVPLFPSGNPVGADLTGSFITGSFDYDNNALTTVFNNSNTAITNFGFNIHTTSGATLSMTTPNSIMRFSTSVGWDFTGFANSSSTALPVSGATLASAGIVADVTPIPSSLPTDLSLFTGARALMVFNFGSTLGSQVIYTVTSITARSGILPTGGNTPTTTTSSIPEPAPLALLGLGLMGLGMGLARRRRR